MAGTWWKALGEGIKGAGQGVNTYFVLKQQALENALKDRQMREEELRSQQDQKFKAESLGLQRQQAADQAAARAAAEKSQRQQIQLRQAENMTGGDYDPSVGLAFDEEIRPLVGQMVKRPDQLGAWSGVEGEEGPVVESWQDKFKVNRTPADRQEDAKRIQLEQMWERIQNQAANNEQLGQYRERMAGAAEGRVAEMMERLKLQQELADAKRQQEYERLDNEALEAARVQARQIWNNPAKIMQAMQEAAKRSKETGVNEPFDLSTAIEAEAQRLYAESPLRRRSNTGIRPSSPSRMPRVE